MSSETQIAVTGVVFYALASVLSIVSLVKDDRHWDKAGFVGLVMGAACLTGGLLSRIIQAGCVPSLNRFDGIAAYVLALSVVYLMVNASRSRRGVAGLLFPFLTILLLCGITAQGEAGGIQPAPQNHWLVLHVVVGYMAYAVFSLASLNAVAYLLQDYNMKQKKFGPVWEKMPSLETLDHLMSRLVGMAFLLLTTSVVLGCVLVHRAGGGERWITDPKVAAVAAVWILFAVLVHMRASADRHGRGVALLTVAGLAVVLFAFIGVHFVADSLHAFLKVCGGLGKP